MEPAPAGSIPLGRAGTAEPASVFDLQEERLMKAAQTRKRRAA